MLLELFGGRRKKGTTSLLLLLVWCLEIAGGRTLYMSALGGLYRPTPRGYNGNPTGRGAQPSVTALAGFWADCWGPLAGGSHRLPTPWQQAGPTSKGLVDRWLLLPQPDDEGFVEVSVAIVPPSGGRLL